MLNDREIREALEAKEIVIDGLADPEKQIQPCSVDLRISGEFLRYDKSIRVVHLGRPPIMREGALETFPIDERHHSQGFRLKPGKFALGCTIEKVKLPSHIMARVEGRSSIGRAGLFVHVTAGFIDPGFEGRITLELFNASPVPIVVPLGYRICQLAFERLSGPCERPYGAARGSKYVGDRAEGVQAAVEET